MKKNKEKIGLIEYLMTYGWAVMIILIAFVALFYLGVFKPSFNPDEDVCLGGTCFQPEGNYESGYCNLELHPEHFVCKEWRPKNICEKEPEAEHNECVCLERNYNRYGGKYIIGNWTNPEEEIKYVERGCKFNELLQIYWDNATEWSLICGSCKKARLKNVCEDDPNNEVCECDEWGEIEELIEDYYGYRKCFEEIGKEFCDKNNAVFEKIDLSKYWSSETGMNYAYFICFDKEIRQPVKYYFTFEDFDYCDRFFYKKIIEETCTKAHLKEEK